MRTNGYSLATLSIPGFCFGVTDHFMEKFTSRLNEEKLVRHVVWGVIFVQTPRLHCYHNFIRAFEEDSTNI